MMKESHLDLIHKWEFLLKSLMTQIWKPPLLIQVYLAIQKQSIPVKPFVSRSGIKQRKKQLPWKNFWEFPGPKNKAKH